MQKAKHHTIMIWFQSNKSTSEKKIHATYSGFYGYQFIRVQKLRHSDFLIYLLQENSLRRKKVEVTFAFISPDKNSID